MILIISQIEFEESTNKVIDWLDYYQANYLKINGDELIDSFIYSLVDENWRLYSDKFKLPPPCEISVIWNRRWVSNPVLFQKSHVFKDEILNKENLNYIRNEYTTLKELFAYYYKDCKWVDPIENIKLNKLVVLEKAQSIGLEVPKTIITSEKEVLENFIKSNGDVIIKSLYQLKFITIDNTAFNMYTEKISLELLDKLPETFFPACFQTLINKKFEIRIFYFFGQISAMVIFSQLEDATKIDFRAENYNDLSIKKTPFLLPSALNEKIDALMKELGLCTGSIDMLVSNKNEYIFLEVNPIGQFGMTSVPCNYHIEKDIALKFIEMDKEFYERKLTPQA
ncbi:MAG: grasp-with-spasm system ATP-grasp peptide maturase [Sphingobacterium sp.]|jgi:ATP-GRASP peptide maturase of grasp-with-spasm system|nr:grasp-with-spasm system ATP-grasp peptide maturase [Sphingobacterium sp.]